MTAVTGKVHFVSYNGKFPGCYYYLEEEGIVLRTAMLYKPLGQCGWLQASCHSQLIKVAEESWKRCLQLELSKAVQFVSKNLRLTPRHKQQQRYCGFHCTLINIEMTQQGMGLWIRRVPLAFPKAKYGQYMCLKNSV